MISQTLGGNCMKLTHDEDRLFEVLMDIKERFPRVKRLDWIIPSVKFYLSTVDFLGSFNDSISVLDVGCSYGYGVYILSSVGGFNVLGIDIDKNAVNYAKEAVNLPNASFEIINILRQKDVDALLMKYGPFDAITCFEVFEHIPAHYSKILLAHCFKLLKSGGFLFISTPNKPVYDVDTYTPDHINEIQYDDFLRLIRESGFEVLTVKGIFKTSPLLIKLIYRLNLAARIDDRPNALSPLQRLIRYLLVSIFDPRRILLSISPHIDYNLFLKMKFKYSKCDDSVSNASLIYVIAKRIK